MLSLSKHVPRDQSGLTFKYLRACETGCRGMRLVWEIAYGPAPQMVQREMRFDVLEKPLVDARTARREGPRSVPVQAVRKRPAKTPEPARDRDREIF